MRWTSDGDESLFRLTTAVMSSCINEEKGGTSHYEPNSGKLGSFRGRLHTQSRPIKGENPTVWFALVRLSEFHTQTKKRSQMYQAFDVSKTNIKQLGNR
jgi:hypothetical protein